MSAKVEIQTLVQVKKRNGTLAKAQSFECLHYELFSVLVVHHLQFFEQIWLLEERCSSLVDSDNFLVSKSLKVPPLLVYMLIEIRKF